MDKIPKLALHGAESRPGRRLVNEQDSKNLIVNFVNVARSDEEQEKLARKIVGTIDDYISNDGGSGRSTYEKIKSNRFQVDLPLVTKKQADRIILRVGGVNGVNSVQFQPQFHALNEEAEINMRGSTLFDPSLMDLTGEGQIVGVADSGLDYDMCFFRDDNEEVAFGSGSTANYNHRKIVQYNDVYGDATEGEILGHGTHVAGSIAGNSLSGSQEGNGMAPNAKLAFFDLAEPYGSFVVPGDVYNDLLLDSYLLGARIHSDSWGSFGNHYDTITQDFDKFMYENDDFLMLVAGGNDGDLDIPYGSIGVPATFKNGLAVGASGNLPKEHGVYDEQVVDWSSIGPTRDGRLKPDVLAPGRVIYSAASDESTTSNNCEVDGMSGTSMATPLTAGAAALIREYFINGYYPTGVATPGNEKTELSAALIKAMLIQSGQAVYGMTPAPSMTQGFGRVDLGNVLVGEDTTDFDLFVHDEVLGLVTGGVSDPVCFDVQDSREFKVTLVWTDKEAEVNTQHGLVNDLSLSVLQDNGVSTPGNHRYNPKGAELTVGGDNVQFGYTTLGRTLDITPPLTAPSSVLGDACGALSPLGGDVLVHDVAMGAGCDLLTAATNAQNAGAVAMVVVTEEFQLLTEFDGDIPSTITIPVVTTNDISAFTPGSEVTLGVEEAREVDTDNNVEQVRITHSGVVTVLVLGAEIATEAPQKYALVVTGGFGQPITCPVPEPDCPLCLHGECVGGQCICDTNWGGDYCGEEICPDMCSGNGVCTPGGCECDGAYRGDGCEVSVCGGIVYLYGNSGTFSHDASGAPYQNDLSCAWVFMPEDPNTNLKFTWAPGDVDLEDMYDYLYIRDGQDPFNGPVLAELTGMPTDEGGLFTDSNAASAMFVSDEEFNAPGFTLHWEALACLDDCNDVGTCPPEPESDGTCDCPPGTSGPNCGTPCTPESCHNGGICTEAGVCQCAINWFGETCEIKTGGCEGLTVYTADGGEFGDGSGPDKVYNDNLVCGFYVAPAGGASSIEFMFNEFHLERRFDFLYVYSDLQQTDLLLVLDGDDEEGKIFKYDLPALYFVFTSDIGWAWQGFDLVYTSDAYQCDASSCVNGVCENDECQCSPGWKGFHCSSEVCPNDCSGNGVCTPTGCECSFGYFGEMCLETACRGETTLTGNSGDITHDISGADYVSNSDCVWWFTPEDPNTNIRFSWASGDIYTEEGWDFLFIYDGLEDSPELAQFSGMPDGGEVTSYSPVAGVRFQSDGAYNEPGFTLHWEALTCTEDCNGDAGTCPPEPESDFFFFFFFFF